LTEHECRAHGADELVEAEALRARRVVYLSAEAAARGPDSFWAAVERAVERFACEWAFLRPTGFAANTLMWADEMRPRVAAPLHTSSCSRVQPRAERW
jgi:hypothetical protein